MKKKKMIALHPCSASRTQLLNSFLYVSMTILAKLLRISKHVDIPFDQKRKGVSGKFEEFLSLNSSSLIQKSAVKIDQFVAEGYVSVDKTRT